MVEIPATGCVANSGKQWIDTTALPASCRSVHTCVCTYCEPRSMHTRVHVLRAVGPCTHVCVCTASRTSLHTRERMYKRASKPDPFLSSPWARQEHTAWLFPMHTHALGPAAFPYSHPNPTGPLGRERHWGAQQGSARSRRRLRHTWGHQGG